MTNPDVTCLLQGRLGNNLFQVAATAAYAKRHGRSWAVPFGYGISPELYDFGLPLTDATADRVVWQPPVFGYHDIPYYPPGTRLILFGYYQSHRHFSDCTDYIREIFPLPDVPMIDAVSLHVRRGDYVVYPETCPPLALDYYAAATKVFTDRGQCQFLVFSDDLNWCRENLLRCNDKAHFNIFGSSNLRLNLATMAACRDHIIANSTFSWWGAWFNRKLRLVVCPRHEDWFNRNVHHDMSQLYPPDWMQIPAPHDLPN